MVGDASPRYIATAGGKIPLHRRNAVGPDNNDLILKKPWNGKVVKYPDAGLDVYADSPLNKQCSCLHRGHPVYLWIAMTLHRVSCLRRNDNYKRV
jgi:hypothetical protein